MRVSSKKFHLKKKKKQTRTPFFCFQNKNKLNLIQCVMWMKSIALVVVFICIDACEKQKRATFLTDESKRILDIFDFSNFDKQEGLSYIDKQRYENLIRGKRSRWNICKAFWEPNLNFKVCGDTFNENSRNDGSGKGRRDDYPVRVNLKNENPLKDEFLKKRISIFKPSEKRAKVINFVRKKKDIKTGKSPEKLNETTTDLTTDEHEESLDEEDDDYDEEEEERRRRRRRKKKRRRRRYWNKWGEWSPCSVTCGKGRRIRSRKCIAKLCSLGDIEMGEKTCQLPACSLFDKLFSFFK